MTVATIRSLPELAAILGTPVRELEDLAATAARHYRPRSIQSGAKARWIEPPVGPLKAIQTRIQRHLFAGYPYPAWVHGVRGQSAKRNASQHCAQPEVVRVDIAHCFRAISHQMVFDTLTRRLGLSPSATRLLTKLTTYRGHLPQGSPTSPDLANLVLLDVDEQIKPAAVAAGCVFTRWVDDLTLSGPRSVPAGLIPVAFRVLRSRGFQVNRPKLSIRGRNRPQPVTGYLVNANLPSVAKEKRAQARAAVSDIARHVDPERARARASGLVTYVASANVGAARLLRRKLDGA